uniref:Putative secreted protein n=1 Tax=Anopheles darlingi TaxID=43151 RepID=A0A2M4DLC5_ANODA
MLLLHLQLYLLLFLWLLQHRRCLLQRWAQHWLLNHHRGGSIARDSELLLLKQRLLLQHRRCSYSWTHSDCTTNGDYSRRYRWLAAGVVSL